MDVSIVARELQEVENMIEIVRKDLEGAPEGRLRIACKRRNEQYYQVTKDSNTQGHYISKKKNGYVMGDDFLCTFETYRHPIDIKSFEAMLRTRFM